MINDFQLSVRSVIIVKLRTKSSQIKTTCKYTIDTGNDGNLMPTEIFKVLFSVTKIANLNKSTDKKEILCT